MDEVKNFKTIIEKKNKQIESLEKKVKNIS